jgi:hypothetical protein
MDLKAKALAGGALDEAGFQAGRPDLSAGTLLLRRDGCDRPEY